MQFSNKTYNIENIRGPTNKDVFRDANPGPGWDPRHSSWAPPRGGGLDIPGGRDGGPRAGRGTF